MFTGLAHTQREENSVGHRGHLRIPPATKGLKWDLQGLPWPISRVLPDRDPQRWNLIFWKEDGYLLNRLTLGDIMRFLRGRRCLWVTLVSTKKKKGKMCCHRSHSVYQLCPKDGSKEQGCHFARLNLISRPRLWNHPFSRTFPFLFSLVKQELKLITTCWFF